MSDYIERLANLEKIVAELQRQMANKSTKSSRMVKPALDEIKQYCMDNHITLDCEKFWNYYESNGWKVGKNAMKNWKAAVRTWASQQVSTRLTATTAKEYYG